MENIPKILEQRRDACLERIGRLASAVACLGREQDKTLNELLIINTQIASYETSEI